MFLDIVAAYRFHCVIMRCAVRLYGCGDLDDGYNWRREEMGWI